MKILLYKCFKVTPLTMALAIGRMVSGAITWKACATGIFLLSAQKIIF